MTSIPGGVHLTHDEYEDLHARNEATAMQLSYATDALKKLVEAARGVIEHRDDPFEEGQQIELQGWITELEESIPCDDCMHAPCCCEHDPNDRSNR